MDNQINNENINNETEEKEKLVIPIQVYVVVCIGILLISIIVGMVIAKDNKEKPEESNNNTKVEEKVPETDKNKFSDKDAKKIYETKLPFVGHYVMQENLYTTSKVTYENANKSYLRAFAFQNIKFSEGQISSYVNEDGTLMCETDEIGCDFDSLLSEGWYVFDQALLQESAKKLYGREISNGDFKEYLESGATYKDGKYYHNQGGGSNFLSHHYREYVSFELKDDTLYINDKYLYIYGELDARNEHYLVTIYGDSAKKNKIGTATYLDADNLVDFIVPTYERKKSNYQHVFKKDEKGNWYWVSSEPIVNKK